MREATNVSNQNVDRLRQAYQQWHATRGGSVEIWMDLLTDDVKMGSLADGAAGVEFSKARQGKNQAEQYFQELEAGWQLVHFTPETFVAEDDRVVMIGRCAFRSRATEKIAESPVAHVFRSRDGKIVEFFEFFDTAKAWQTSLPA